MKFPEGTIPCRNYRSYDPSKLSEHLPGVDWNLISNYHEVNLAWRIFKNKLSTLFNKFAPVIAQSTRKRP